MNECPHCGAAIVDSVALFCTRCGKPLDDVTKTDEQSGQQKSKREIIAESPKSEGDYDGYYDDVHPMDEGFHREGVDRSLIKRIVLLIVGFLLAIVACVAMMYLL